MAPRDVYKRQLLLDEPTAGLDPISSAEINELIMKLQRERKMASVVVTHNLHSAKTVSYTHLDVYKRQPQKKKSAA